MNKRLRREELRALVLGAGVDVLERDGVTPGLTHVTFAAAFDLVHARTGRRLTNASVYERVWADQEAFRWDVLATLIDGTDPANAATRDRVALVLDEADVASEDGRRAALHRLCRVAVHQHVADASARARTRIITATMGALASQSPGTQDPAALEVRRALHDYVEREVADLSELYREVGRRLGLRLREPYELRQLVLAVAAVAEGIATRVASVPEYSLPISVPELDGSPADGPWDLAGLAVEGIVGRVVELDPGWSPPA